MGSPQPPFKASTVPVGAALFVAACVALSWGPCGCAGPGGARTPPGSSTPIERYFPLQDMMYTYQVSAQGRSPDMFMVRVRRTGPSSADLRTGATSKTLVFDAVSVRRQGGGILLRAPFDVGASWTGDRGQTRITDVQAVARVPAGTFQSCVKTVEEVGGDARGRITTVYCPDVGITSMQVEQWSGAEQTIETVELRAYGPPMDLKH